MSKSGKKDYYSEPNSLDSMPKPDSNEWVVYGANWCGFCKRAKQILETNGCHMTYVLVDQYGGPDIVRDYLRSHIGDYHTVPLVFNKGNFLGGCSEVKKLFTNKVGGTSDVKPMTDEVVDYCDQVKNELLEKIGESNKYRPVVYKTQVVNGTNYFVKIELDKDCVHARLHLPIGSKKVTLVSHQHPKKMEDSIEYF